MHVQRRSVAFLVVGALVLSGLAVLGLGLRDRDAGADPFAARHSIIDPQAGDLADPYLGHAVAAATDGRYVAFVEGARGPPQGPLGTLQADHIAITDPDGSRRASPRLADNDDLASFAAAPHLLADGHIYSRTQVLDLATGAARAAPWPRFQLFAVASGVGYGLDDARAPVAYDAAGAQLPLNMAGVAACQRNVPAPWRMNPQGAGDGLLWPGCDPTGAFTLSLLRAGTAPRSFPVAPDEAILLGAHYAILADVVDGTMAAVMQTPDRGVVLRLVDEQGLTSEVPFEGNPEGTGVLRVVGNRWAITWRGSAGEGTEWGTLDGKVDGTSRQSWLSALPVGDALVVETAEEVYITEPASGFGATFVWVGAGLIAAGLAAPLVFALVHRRAVQVGARCAACGGALRSGLGFCALCGAPVAR